MAMLSFNAPGEREKSLWLVKKETNPNHSQWYIDRFKAMEAEGNDMAGESRMVNALASRGAKILDAGSGPGRVGKQLHALGHRVTGVDIDPELIEEARRVCPDATWITADLVDLPEVLGIEGDATAENGFELLVENFRRVLAPGGRAVVGYGSGPGRDYAFEQFLADAREVGLNVDNTYSSWQMHPYQEGSSEFLVAVLSRPEN